MQDILFSSAAQQGIWAILFVSLYLYQLREARRLQSEAKDRENKLTDFISKISTQYEVLAHQLELLTKRYEKMGDDISEIKTELQVSGRKKY
ncbi:MAG TPA: BhlA/UviB family holin-like peptide [Bacillota bacterium]|nr:BhlA/UviB family holin-like peptide [Bacillota bacterium]